MPSEPIDVKRYTLSAEMDDEEGVPMAVMTPALTGKWIRYADLAEANAKLVRTLGAILDRIDMAPNDDPLPYIREYVARLQQNGGLG